MRREGKSFNIVDRLFERQALQQPPGTTIIKQRQMFEVVVPNSQAKQVELPDSQICKFVPSGDLVCFGNMQHEIVVYQYTGLRMHCEGEVEVSTQHISEGLPFGRFFQLKFRQTLAHGDEVLCKELCLVAAQQRYLLVASSTPNMPPTTTDTHPMPNLPFVASTTFHLIRAEDGELCSQYRIRDDFVHLGLAQGVFLLDDMLCILAMRSQTIHILHITDSGKLIAIQRLGTYCRDDDELVLARYMDMVDSWDAEHAEDWERGDVGQPQHASPFMGHRQPSQQPHLQPGAAHQHDGRVSRSLQRASSAPSGREHLWPHVLQPAHIQRQRLQGLGRGMPFRGGIAPSSAGVVEPTSHDIDRPEWRGMIDGIRQRIMAYLFHYSGSAQLSADNRKRFFYHFEDYASMVMWKAQMLDKEHLLISMGPSDGREGLSTAGQNYCLLVWSIPEAHVVDLHDVSSLPLLQSYQKYWHNFHADSILSPWHQFFTPPAACQTPLSSNASSVAVRRILSNLPASSQAISPSPYLDAQLFQYDEKLISAMVRPRPFTETPLKFAARSTGKIRFKLQLTGNSMAGRELANGARSMRHMVAYHFHPWLPLVLCIAQSFVAPPQLTIFLKSELSS